MADELTIVRIYPELLGTYGDRGNGLALVHRAEARGIAARVIDVSADDPLPRSGDIYLLGGGEDSSQLLAARSLMADDQAHRVLATAPCLAVCAGLQLMAQSFYGADGRPQPGLGLIDVTSGRLAERAVGEVVTEPDELPGIGTLTGFENHRGGAVLGPDARPLGRLLAGVGNGDDRYEGAVQGATIATYLHGPVLVRNPGLADLLLERAVGHELAPYVDPAVDQLRAERLDAADPRRRESRSWRSRLRRAG